MVKNEKDYKEVKEDFLEKYKKKEHPIKIMQKYLRARLDIEKLDVSLNTIKNCTLKLNLTSRQSLQCCRRQ